MKGAELKPLTQGVEAEAFPRWSSWCCGLRSMSSRVGLFSAPTCAAKNKFGTLRH